MGVRLVERIGRAAGFKVVGRPVRVWVVGAPGGDETEVVTGRIVATTGANAVVELDEPWEGAGVPVKRFLGVPGEDGWGLDALWFSFIAVDAYALDGEGVEDQAAATAREPLGRWSMRLGGR